MAWKRWPGPRTIHPLETMQSPHKEPHPVELLLLLGIAVIWAVRELLVALLALVLTLADRRPAAPEPEPVPAEPAPAAPLQHPLAVLAAELEALPQRQLMQLAGTRRRLPKRQLTELLVAACR